MCTGSVESVRPMYWVRIPTISPQCLALSGVEFDPRCPGISVSSINLMAFAAALPLVQYVPRLCRPGRGPSFWRRSSRYLRDRISTCDTIWRPSRHGQLASVASGTLRLKETPLSPIFSVRNWARSALWRLPSPSCSRRTFFLVGLSV